MKHFSLLLAHLVDKNVTKQAYLQCVSALHGEEAVDIVRWLLAQRNVVKEEGWRLLVGWLDLESKLERVGACSHWVGFVEFSEDLLNCEKLGVVDCRRQSHSCFRVADFLVVQTLATFERHVHLLDILEKKCVCVTRSPGQIPYDY